MHILNKTQFCWHTRTSHSQHNRHWPSASRRSNICYVKIIEPWLRSPKYYRSSNTILHNDASCYKRPADYEESFEYSLRRPTRPAWAL